MSMTKKQIVEAAFELGALAPSAKRSEVVDLFKAARALDSLNEAECNAGLTPAQEKARDRHEAEVLNFCNRYGLAFDLFQDPRGCSVEIAGGRVCLW
jgi:hypothetical protein